MSDSVTAFARTLDQELLALSRGASLECPCCGEFVMRLRGVLACPECRSLLADGREIPEVVLPRAEYRVGIDATPDWALPLPCRPDGRGRGVCPSGLTLVRGKSGHRRAGRWGNPRRRKPTESGTERRPPVDVVSTTWTGKGETVG